MSLRRKITGLSQNKAYRGTVISWVNDKVDVRLAGGRVLRSIQFVGGPLRAGMGVIVDMTSGKYIASAVGEAVVIPPTRSTEVRSISADPDGVAAATGEDAISIHGYPIDVPVDAQFMVFNQSTGRLEWDTPSAGSPLTVEEIDAAPSVANVTTIKVTNGTLTDDGAGVITLDFGSAATDDAAIHDNVSGEINALTEKAVPVSADLLVIEDSADTFSKKKIQVGNLPQSAAGMENPMTTAGDIIVGGTAGAAQRLGVGSEGRVLMIVSGVPAWATPSTGDGGEGFLGMDAFVFDTHTETLDDSGVGV